MIITTRDTELVLIYQCTVKIILGESTLFTAIVHIELWSLIKVAILLNGKSYCHFVALMLLQCTVAASSCYCKHKESQQMNCRVYLLIITGYKLTTYRVTRD